jgi:hypothetical protein
MPGESSCYYSALMPSKWLNLSLQPSELPLFIIDDSMFERNRQVNLPQKCRDKFLIILMGIHDMGMEIPNQESIYLTI